MWNQVWLGQWKGEGVQALKRKGIIALALIGLLATSGLAYAVPPEVEDPEDTVFNFSYDGDSLWWNTSASGLTASAVTSGGAEVAGPNDQVNHGMFMKAFKPDYVGQGRGCLNRHLAQSDFGKGGTGAVGPIDTDCEHGKKGEAPGTAFSSDQPGRPESPGKSEAAPGHNKES